MGRGFLQRKDYEAEFGKVIRGAIFARGQCQDAEKVLGISHGTLSNRFKTPGNMSLLELKRFIAYGGIPKEDVINYLYEGSEKK